MSRIIRVIFVLLICITLFNIASSDAPADSQIPVLIPKQDSLTGLWGYQNTEGELVIHCQYKRAYPFRGEYAQVTVSGEEGGTFDGIIDIAGRWVLSPNYHIDSEDNFFAPIGSYEAGIYIVQNEDGYGFFDIPTGFFSGIRYDEISEPLWYGSIIDDELICVVINNKKGFASRQSGEIMIDCLYSPYFQYYLRGDYCVVKTDGYDETWVLIDRQGEQIPLPNDCFIEDQDISVYNGVFPICDLQTGLYGYCDIYGNIVIAPQYEYAYSFVEGLATVELASGEWAVITTEGRTVFFRDDNPQQHNSSPSCDHGLFKCGPSSENTIKYLDCNGELAFTIHHEGLISTGSFMENGLALYYIEEEGNIFCGIFNNEGKILTEPLYMPPDEEYEIIYSTQCFLPMKDAATNKYGLIDLKGEWLIRPIYTCIYGFINGYAVVQTNEVFSVIDEYGNVY